MPYFYGVIDYEIFCQTYNLIEKKGGKNMRRNLFVAMGLLVSPLLQISAQGLKRVFQTESIDAALRKCGGAKGVIPRLPKQ